MSTELPTLPIGAVLQQEGWEDREVTLSYPGLCLAVTPSRQIWAMGYIEGAWRTHRTGTPYTVKPEPVWRAHCSSSGVTAIPNTHRLPDGMDPHAVAQAVADLLNSMVTEVQP